MSQAISIDISQPFLGANPAPTVSRFSSIISPLSLDYSSFNYKEMNIYFLETPCGNKKASPKVIEIEEKKQNLI